MTFHSAELSVTVWRNDQNIKLKPLIQAPYHMKNDGHICHFPHLDFFIEASGFFAPAEHITAISDKIKFLVIACGR